jgi:hypothetical protein
MEWGVRRWGYIDRQTTKWSYKHQNFFLGGEGGWIQKHMDAQTDGQTWMHRDRWTDTNGYTDRQTWRLFDNHPFVIQIRKGMDSETHGRADRWTDTDGRTDRWTDTDGCTETDGQTNGYTDRQTWRLFDNHIFVIQIRKVHYKEVSDDPLFLYYS